jgi:hypothetical protein
VRFSLIGDASRPKRTEPSSSSDEAVPSSEPSATPLASLPLHVPFTMSNTMFKVLPARDVPSRSMMSLLTRSSSIIVISKAVYRRLSSTL